VTGNLVCHGAETATASAAKHATAEHRMNRPIVPTTTFRQGSLPLSGAAETINETHDPRPATLRLNRSLIPIIGPRSRFRKLAWDEQDVLQEYFEFLRKATRPGL
jgi:hypothetical protein